ncbi:hypothetical protein [Streptacidiphilus sp. MAP5-3]|uniref:hypothetical protein n=1 Tax=unclassified Streptacidiphilus TaxID=2643834 RepID=UPI003514FE40
MIPEFRVDVDLDYDLEALRTDLDAEDVVEGFTEHHEYECMGLPSWDDALDCLAEEGSLLARAEKSDAADGVRVLLDELRESDDIGYAELTGIVFSNNDPGVAGLSTALSAARVATFYSCSAGGNHHAEYPMVGAVPDRARAELLVDLIRKSGCGVGQTYGRWYIYSRSVWQTHALAKAIIDSRELFDVIPAPAWTDGLQEMLDDWDG